MTASSPSSRSPITALVLGWLIPGAGHAYGGQRGKALLFAILIVGLLVTGFILGDGTNIRNDLWLAPQAGAGGPVALLWSLGEYRVSEHPIDWASPWREMGTLYTAIAGLLNLLVMLDAYISIAYPEEKQARIQHRTSHKEPAK